MFHRMRDAGFVTGPPYELTDAGRAIVERARQMGW